MRARSRARTPRDNLQKKASSCNAKLGNLPRLRLLLAAHLVRRAPTELARVDSLRAVACVPHGYLLRYALALLRGEVAACLRLELEFEALCRVFCG